MLTKHALLTKHTNLFNIHSNTNNPNAQSPASPVSAEPQRQNLNTAFDRTASSETDPPLAATEGKRGILGEESFDHQNQDADHQQNSGLTAEDEIVGRKGAAPETPDMIDEPAQEKIETRAAQPEDYSLNDTAAKPVKDEAPTTTETAKSAFWNVLSIFGVGTEKPTEEAQAKDAEEVPSTDVTESTEEAQAKSPEEIAKEVAGTNETEEQQPKKQAEVISDPVTTAVATNEVAKDVQDDTTPESEAAVDEEPNLKETESENPVATTNDYLVATSNTTNPHHAPATATVESQAAPADEYTIPTSTTESQHAADTTNQLTPASTTEAPHAPDTTNELNPASTTESHHAADITNELAPASSTTESHHVPDTTNEVASTTESHDTSATGNTDKPISTTGNTDELIPTSTTESKPAPAANTGDEVIPTENEPAHPIDNTEALHQHGAYHDPSVTEPIRRQEKIQGLIDTVVGKLEKVVGARKKANVRLERGKERLEEAKHIKETGEVSAAMVRDVAISGKVADTTRKRELGKEDTITKDQKDKSLGLGLTLPEDEDKASDDKTSGKSEDKAPVEDGSATQDANANTSAISQEAGNLNQDTTPSAQDASAKTPALSDEAGNLNKTLPQLPQDKPSVPDANETPVLSQESSNINQA